MGFFLIVPFAKICFAKTPLPSSGMIDAQDAVPKRAAQLPWPSSALANYWCRPVRRFFAMADVHCKLTCKYDFPSCFVCVAGSGTATHKLPLRFQITPRTPPHPSHPTTPQRQPTAGVTTALATTKTIETWSKR
jgi:hypothetical protein